MFTAREVSEYEALVGALQTAADQASMEGHPLLAGALVNARQALRGMLTRALEMQRLAEETDAVLSLPWGPSGVAASRIS
jgi:hypothetical protein